MRIHRSKKLTNLWHTLPQEIRRFINSLLVNQQPEVGRAVPNWPGRFETLIAGYWISWQVVKDRGETIVLVRLEEE
jgi:hypothetical protein